jgi:hypothetical protein
VNIFLKIFTWLKVNIASIIGITQAIIKAVKELLTAVINLLSIIFPTVGAQRLVLWLRASLESLDAFIEKVKPYLIPKVA